MATFYPIIASSVILPLVTIICLHRIKQKSRIKQQEKTELIDTLKELVTIKTEIINKLK